MSNCISFFIVNRPPLVSSAASPHNTFTHAALSWSPAIGDSARAQYGTCKKVLMGGWVMDGWMAGWVGGWMDGVTYFGGAKKGLVGTFVRYTTCDAV